MESVLLLEATYSLEEILYTEAITNPETAVITDVCNTDISSVGKAHFRPTTKPIAPIEMRALRPIDFKLLSVTLKRLLMFPLILSLL